METIAVLCACVLIVAYIGWLVRDRCSTCPARERALEALISESATAAADARTDEIVYEWAQLQAELSKEDSVVTTSETKKEMAQMETGEWAEAVLIHGGGNTGEEI
ncbi:MAG: hypothetical protein WC491_08095 [Candidatus Omnitrophota bacterium]|jgi:hypothetical protein